MVKPFEIFEEKSNCQKIIILIINLQVWSSQEKDRKKNKAVKKKYICCRDIKLTRISSE